MAITTAGVLHIHFKSFRIVHLGWGFGGGVVNLGSRREGRGCIDQGVEGRNGVCRVKNLDLENTPIFVLLCSIRFTYNKDSLSYFYILIFTTKCSIIRFFDYF